MRQIIHAYALILTGALLVAGCSSPNAQPAARPSNGSIAIASLDEARLITQGYADSYVTAAIQVMDELRTSKRPDVVKWAMAQKVATATASFTNATQSNPYVGCIDMVILVSLKRTALERYWIPNLLREEGGKASAAAKRAEDDAWGMAEKLLSRQQMDDLRGVIETWVADHPDQYYVGWVRLTDIASERKLTSQSPQLKVPGNIFGLLYLDPLASLDPVTQEMRNYRALTERLTYLFMRVPMIYSWQAELTFDAMTDTGATRDFVSATSKFADATSRFADTVKGYPDAIDKTMDRSIQSVSTIVTRERTAALEQADGVLTGQREGIVKAVEAQQDKMSGLVTEVRAAIADADRSVQTINTTAKQTIDQTDRASERLIARTRNAIIAIIVAACVVPAIVLLAYRVASRRVSPRTEHA